MTQDATLRVQSGTDSQFVPVKYIVVVMAEDKYLQVFTAKNAYRLEDSLTALAPRLGTGFTRVHRKFLVRLSAVKAMVDVEGAKFLEVAGVLTPIPVSRREISVVREKLAARGI